MSRDPDFLLAFLYGYTPSLGESKNTCFRKSPSVYHCIKSFDTVKAPEPTDRPAPTKLPPIVKTTSGLV